MSVNQLNVFEDIPFDDLITKKEFHTYLPYNSTTFNQNDEIRIPIQSQDIYPLPSESFISIEGTFKHETDPNSKLGNNAFAYLFDEIRFELNGVEIDRVRDVGYTSTIKALASLDKAQSESLEMAGWTPFKENKTLTATNFNACIPLNFLMGFAEFYDKIFINCKLELVLIRAHTDDNCFIGKAGEIKITKLQWHVPHISVNDETKLKIMQSLKKDRPIRMAFHRWELHELPSLKANTSDKWSIRTSSQLEKPRYVLAAFQTNKKNVKEADPTDFDHERIRNIKLYLNSESFPYDKQNLDFGLGRYSIAYYMYKIFQKSYYNRESSQPILSFEQFKNCPIFVIDCSKQLESIVTSTVDIQLEFEGDEPFPAKTSLFALILHDALIEYNPVTAIVHKLI